MNLGNVISASYKADKKTPFVSMEDHHLMEANLVQSFEVQVGGSRKRIELWSSVFIV